MLVLLHSPVLVVLELHQSSGVFQVIPAYAPLKSGESY